MGRPRRDGPQLIVSSRVVAFKVTPEEGSRLEAQAAYRQLSISEYLRALVVADGQRLKTSGVRIRRKPV